MSPPAVPENQSEHAALLPRARKIVAQYSVLYPFKGIYYFLAHPFLWPLFRARLLPCVLLSIAVLFILFMFTYLPQVAFLAIFHGSLAWVNATFLVLGEGAVIVALLFEGFFVDEALMDIFDAVLIEKGLESLVSQGRAINEEGTNPVKRLGKPGRSASYSRFSFSLTIDFIIYLPVNLIPVIGSPLYLILTGHRAGQLHHCRYYQLLKFSGRQERAHIRRYEWDYTWFGTMSLVLQLVPVLSMFFLFTTATGSALWAAVLYKQEEEETAASYVTV